MMVFDAALARRRTVRRDGARVARPLVFRQSAILAWIATVRERVRGLGFRATRRGGDGRSHRRGTVRSSRRRRRRGSRRFRARGRGREPEPAFHLGDVVLRPRSSSSSSREARDIDQARGCSRGGRRAEDDVRDDDVVGSGSRGSRGFFSSTLGLVGASRGRRRVRDRGSRRRAVVDGVTVSAHDGQVLALLGHAGSGASETLEVMSVTCRRDRRVRWNFAARPSPRVGPPRVSAPPSVCVPRATRSKVC